MNQCSDCLKAANGNCGRHLESYLGSVAHAPAPEPKTTAELIQEAVGLALAAERARHADIALAYYLPVPKNHIPCGCKRCLAISQALQKSGL